MPNLLLEALMSQMDGEEFDYPILIVPSTMLKKKTKPENESEDILGTHSTPKPSPTFTGGGVIPSPVPG